jgi:hypothetical protein
LIIVNHQWFVETFGVSQFGVVDSSLMQIINLAPYLEGKINIENYMNFNLWTMNKFVLPWNKRILGIL